MKNVWVERFRSHLGLSDQSKLPELSEKQKGVAIRLLSEVAPTAMKMIARFSSDAGNGERETRSIEKGSELDQITCEEGACLLNKVYCNCDHPIICFNREKYQLIFWSPKAVEHRNRKSPCGKWKSVERPRPIRYTRSNGKVVFG